MSISFLYQGFGLIGYTYVRTTYQDGNVIFTIRHKREISFIVSNVRVRILSYESIRKDGSGQYR